MRARAIQEPVFSVANTDFEGGDNDDGCGDYIFLVKHGQPSHKWATQFCQHRYPFPGLLGWFLDIQYPPRFVLLGFGAECGGYCHAATNSHFVEAERRTRCVCVTATGTVGASWPLANENLEMFFGCCLLGPYFQQCGALLPLCLPLFVLLFPSVDYHGPVIILWCGPR